MRLALVGRMLVSLWFAAHVATTTSWLGAAGFLADYFRLDGLLALVLSVVFLREAMGTRATREGALAIVLLVDGVGRVAAGFAVHRWPGLLEFPVTLVASLGFMAMCTAAVGLSEGTIVVEEEAARHRRRPSRPQLPAGPVGVASLVSIAFGVAAIMSIGNMDLMQRLLAGHMASIALVMGALAWSRRQRKPLLKIGIR